MTPRETQLSSVFEIEPGSVWLLVVSDFDDAPTADELSDLIDPEEPSEADLRAQSEREEELYRGDALRDYYRSI